MCNRHTLSVNAEFRRDPTRSKTLRQRFVTQFNKRWRAVLKELDSFMVQAPALMANRDYDFPVGPLDTATVLDFVNEAVRANVMDPQEAMRVVRERGVQPQPGNWVEEYLYAAYEKGVRRAQNEVNRKLPEGRKVALMEGAIKRKNHQQKMEQILGRVYTDLQGINEAMEAGIRREIALGLEQGQGTAAIAKRIRDRVEKIGRTRSRVLARTEVIRSHHTANVATYREAGVRGVTVQAEFATAGDQRVCEDCAGLEGAEYTLAEVENLIPVHPNCRCVAIPVVDV